MRKDALSLYDPENSKVFSLQFRHLLGCACFCGGCSNACQTVAAPASRPSRRMLEFIGGLIGRRDASERFPRTCVAEERARFYIFQSWRDPLLRCPSCP
ncbi:hypothetical protein DBL06_13210 [Agrobacterium pusense]|nr:hypothetical protein DBL06_13210 [Agrobacterium pusense]